MANETSIFNQFVGKYQLSKTLRFELKPVGNTEKMLEDENVFEKDRIIEEKYQQTKPFFNRLHRDFINNSLVNKKIDGLDIYFDALIEYQKKRKDKTAQKRLKDISQTLRTQIISYFDTEILFGEGVFAALELKYGKESDSFLKDKKGEFVLGDKGKKISIFDSWKGFTGYFTKFQETRKNFYKDDGTSTAIATRIVDQNLKRFCENIQVFNSLKGKINFKEVEDNFSVRLEDVFSVDYYNKCLLQSGIDKYNEVVGGRSENGEKLRGLNELINKYRQDNKGEKSPFFKALDRQILSEGEKFIIGIENDEQLLETLVDFYKSAEEKTKVLKNLFNDFFSNTASYDIEKIYISKEGLNTILYKWMNDEGRFEFEKNLYEATKYDKLVKFETEDNSYKYPDFIAIEYIRKALSGKFESRIWKEKYFKEKFGKEGILNGNESLWEQFIAIFKFEFFSLFKKETQEIVNGVEKKTKEGYEYARESFENIIKREKNGFSITQEDRLTIRKFADNVLWIYQMAKYFAIEKKRKWLDIEYDTDPAFYDHAEYGFKTKFYNDAYEKIVKTRMLLQSYLTKKPFNRDKWKLNFECGYLLGGWSSTFETYGALLFRKNSDYYVGIVNGSSLPKATVERLKQNITEENSCQKMVYDFQKPDNKNVPRLFIRSKGENFAPSVNELNLPVNLILESYDKGLFKTENKNHPLFKESLKKLIDYFKIGFSKHSSYKHFSFRWKDSSKYENIADFYSDTIRSCYKLDWEELNFEEIKRLTHSGNMFLFQIYSKDFSTKSRGLKNLHSLYFQGLFSEENLNNKDSAVLKLSGGGEIFFRPKTDVKKLGERIDNGGKTVIKNKRYSLDKIFLHFPIELNYARSQRVNFNTEINDFLADNPDINIIGVDRGEKHLIYYAGIDRKGNILKDENGKEILGSLNEINGVSYYSLLKERSKAREQARQDWQDIQGIRDLKKGYISLVVRKFADLIIEHNAILVLEDLNMRFKQIHGGIEKSVYQQLEKALIEKLNFLVNKGEKDPEKAGHLLRAYQLTAPFRTFKDMGKQTGVIFYTQAGYTSKTCPYCGFRPNVKWEQDDIKEKILEGKVKITQDKDNFTIAYRLSHFTKNNNKSKRGNILYENEDRQDEFVIITLDSIRYKWFRRDIKDSELYKGEEKLKEQTQRGVIVKYDIGECLKGLFERNGIDCQQNIQNQLLQKELPKDFYKDICKYLHLLTNIRSSLSGTDVDYINCPSCGFHSDKGFRGYAFNGDANGAYNIARKGAMVLAKINQYKKEHGTLDKMNWGDLFIDIEEWDKYTQVVSKV